MTIPRAEFQAPSPPAPSAPAAAGAGVGRPGARFGSRERLWSGGRVLCVLALALGAATPAAAETSYYNLLGGWSKHFSTERDLNESHWGVGLEVEHGLGAWTVGGAVLNFRNSFSERSTFLGGIAKRCAAPGERWRACAGLTAGIVDGYQSRNGGGLGPTANAVADLSYGRFGAGLICGPTATRNAFCLALVRIQLYSHQGF